MEKNFRDFIKKKSYTCIFVKSLHRRQAKIKDFLKIHFYRIFWTRWQKTYILVQFSRKLEISDEMKKPEMFLPIIIENPAGKFKATFNSTFRFSNN